MGPRAPIALLILGSVAVGCPTATEPEICADGVDNDADGATDCEDVVCAPRFDCRGAVAATTEVIVDGWFLGAEIQEFNSNQPAVALTDLDGDGATDALFASRQPAAPDPSDEHEAWVALSANATLETRWLDDFVIRLPTQPAWTMQWIDGGCDADGDGFDDLFVGDGIPNEEGSRPLLHHIGGARLGQLAPGRQQWDQTWDVALGQSSSVQCLDNLGHPLLPSYAAPELSRLDGLLAGDPLEFHRWTIPAGIGSPTRLTGDLDGDGYAELFWSSTARQGFAEFWDMGLIVPGGAHLDEPSENSTNLEEEVRPGVRIELRTELMEAMQETQPWVDFFDLVGDERRDIFFQLPTTGTYSWRDASVLGELDSELLLEVGPRYTGPPIVQVADLDLDGRRDILFMGSLWPLDWSVIPWAEGDLTLTTALVIGVILDAERLQPGDEITAWEADVAMVTTSSGVPGRGGGGQPGAIQVREDRDGGGLPDIVFVSWNHGSERGPNDEIIDSQGEPVPFDAPYVLPHFGVISTERLLEHTR